jgi:hypothetical protein
MTNEELAADYLTRSKKRIVALEALFKEEAWADVVREAQEVDSFVRISKSLRRDREIAFCGSEDLTPYMFYVREDAETAMANAKFVVEKVYPVVKPQGSFSQ